MRPISAIGDGGCEAGFTLTEMLAVLAIVGLAAAAVLVTAPDTRGTLGQEAERFAARLMRAKEEAVLTNRTIEVRITQTGYDFAVRRGAARDALAERPFTAVAWGANTTAIVSDAGTRSRIAFDPTGQATPAGIALYRDNGSARVTVDAGGNVKLDAR